MSAKIAPYTWNRGGVLDETKRQASKESVSQQRLMMPISYVVDRQTNPDTS